MAKNVIEIILTASDQASQRLKVLGLNLTDLKSGIDLVARGAQQMAQTVQQAWDFSKEGAAVIQTTESFGRLGVSIEELRAASLGTVDDMTLMKASLTLTAGASEQLQQQLLNNAPQLLEIAKAANALNPTLGDTAFMYDSIATGIKRASPMILDNLGITVRIGEANEAYAAQLGKTVEQLSAEEKQIALLNATVAAGDRLIQQAGGTVESYTDAWARLEVEIKNTTDAAKANAAMIGGPVVGRYADFLELSRENEQALIGFGAALRFASFMLTGNEKAANGVNFAWKVLLGDYQAAEDLLRAQWGLLDGEADKLEHSAAAAKESSDAHAQLSKEIERVARAHKLLQGEQDKQRTLTSRLSGAQIGLADDVINSADAWDMYSKALQGSEQASSDYYAEANRLRDIAKQQAIGEANVAAVHSDLTERLEEGAQSLSELYTERQDILAQIQELEAANGRAVTTQARSNLTEAEATLVTLQLADAQAKLAEETDPLKAAQLAVKVEDLSGKLDGATTATTTFIDNSKRIAELQGDYAALGDEIDETTAAIYETIDAFVLQQLQAQLAVDGWTAAENELFISVAQGMGMYDELHANLARELFNMADGLNAVGLSEEEQMERAKAYAVEILGMSEAVAQSYVEQAQQAQAAADAIAGITAASDGVHESVTNVGKEGKTALADITDEATTQVGQLENVGKAADTTYGQISNLGKQGAADLAEIATQSQTNIDKIDTLGESGTSTEGLLTTMTKTATGELVSLATQSDTTLDRIKELGESGGESLGEIDAAARSNADRLDAVGLAADNAQVKIDAMTGKDIYIDVYVREHGNVPSASTDRGNAQAAGGDYFVNRPTPFIAGDLGWERAIFIPQGQPGYDAPTAAMAAAAYAGQGQTTYDQHKSVQIINPIFQGPQVATVRALSQMEF